MILFFRTQSKSVVATEIDHQPEQNEINELCWLYGDATLEDAQELKGFFIGPRREMITPWSTNAVEITQNMSLNGISRIEEYFPVESKDAEHDPMLQRMYDGIDQTIFTVNHEPEPIKYVDNLEKYNEEEGLALSVDEIAYLHKLEKENGRPLTDSEIFGFAQINSEHCRHKIFGGQFIIDGQEKESSLFNLIKKTTQENPHEILSAYKDNVAFSQGPVVEQFAPQDQSTADYFQIKDIESVISLKAETHNFPTTVEPFNGAATGTGGEIRDRMGGGVGSWPIAGTACYMTSYPRLKDDNGKSDIERDWEDILPVRNWLYQTPEQILIKASNGASDFGNKFGQPLITGSLLTFEHQENNEKYAYDKVIMLAGGVGYGKKRDCLKKEPRTGNKVVLVGGDNYRIGLGGGSVSSVDTGRYSNGIELNAIQRANPEMQKRDYNLVRALVEEDSNPVVSIHDHGSAGHLNCLSELVEECGGEIDMTKLPIGDKTLSAKEIIANESQERMGLLIDEKYLEHVQKIADRERAPMYVVGETTGDAHFSFKQADGIKPFDLDVAQMFGHTPKTIMVDETVERKYEDVTYSADKLDEYINRVLQLEAVACKDWLTNKVDRSVTGKVARQQGQGQIQLPLSDCGVVALDYRGNAGIATALGHAPQAGLADPKAGSVLSVAESLTNLVWAPLGRKGDEEKRPLDYVSLSANWMWPCRSQKGEDARLYEGVQALSDFCCAIHVNVPTGKDSLSLTQQYPNGDKIISPGTVIVSAGGEVYDIKKTVSPVLVNDKNSSLYHIDFSFDDQHLGGSAFAQSLDKVGSDVPTVKNPDYFVDCFNAVQELIKKGWIMAGHDISAGGMLTTLLEMTFANTEGGIHINLHDIACDDIVKTLFAENPGVIIQVSDEHKQELRKYLEDNGIGFAKIGYPTPNNRKLIIKKEGFEHEFDIDILRDAWYKTSYLLDRKQSMGGMAKKRYTNYKKQPIEMKFNENFDGSLASYGISADRRKPSGIKAAIIREKGTNGEREMAYTMYLAGFDVKDVMMTDLISGRETLEDVNFIVYCGGFSNSDVLGSAKGWAGAFLYNPKAKEALDKFYAREDTLSLGICNGCQLMVELNLINPEHKHRAHLCHNNSKKFESSFLGLTIPQNNSVMLGSLSGNKLGIWVAHGEGRFYLPEPEDHYNVIAKYNYAEYPGNPNGSDYNVAGICSADGRHLAMMPHPERAIFPWQNAWYPADHRNDDVTPWMEAFVNARKWIEERIK
ncbi:MULTISPECIES: phosphoribosylformylglycinamidine synthase [Segatella]|jgi:phosphoribosylformylglycinamidine synthase|uniref:Phosphoribosylformylglycinamidine synthase n=3 Tax=Prevotellaceae TaxID=171552 RepID=D8DXZ9_9BACT|nr:MULTISPECIES: phosphoribosylformylglycinamidine synthase [Segatella]AGH13978.1 phosphoribosylformylglycinamidine synthase [Prevotella sp. Sc00026]MBQ3857905.1 phosphoribosylformylglycinamidine synthase [Prevotella sp.]EFI71685.1 AIR synthase related protein, C- domain protein [Segatella baroniae B14]MEE3414684.1 phosphoribosylformylglycinamidine synthase [Prevotella sp.]OYP55929.1 phosphoribosylformylglycinamidine synthase [Segatella bryantii]